MEGYIALSRVTDAEGLIIAQPFAPTLFQQGPAPYPTLLLEVLKGKVSQLELEARLEEIEATRTTKLLKDSLYHCGCCDKELYASSFIRPEENSEAYLRNIIDKILMLGACSICLRCRSGLDEQICSLCEEVKDTSQFVKRMHWSDKWRCLSCANPSCTNPECEGATKSTRNAPLPSYLWPKTKEELAGFRCLACREKWKCCLCGQLHLQTKFTAGEIYHKYVHRHKPTCLECMHPFCLNPACTTCKSCRNPKCKEGPSCTEDPKPLVGVALKMMRKTKLCPACRATDIIQCDGCGAMVAKDWTNKNSRHQEIKCLDCLNPRCSSPACTTCKSCRNPSCVSSECKKKPKALNPKQLVAFAKKEDYVCEACLFPNCENCNSAMPKKARELKREKQIVDELDTTENMDMH